MYHEAYQIIKIILNVLFATRQTHLVVFKDDKKDMMYECYANFSVII